MSIANSLLDPRSIVRRLALVSRAPTRPGPRGPRQRTGTKGKGPRGLGKNPARCAMPIVTVFILTADIVVDMAYAFVDPRIRY
jgi:multisubunit Na+/H+ antiporter MnhC subunit